MAFHIAHFTVSLFTFQFSHIFDLVIRWALVVDCCDCAFECSAGQLILMHFLGCMIHLERVRTSGNIIYQKTTEAAVVLCNSCDHTSSLATNMHIGRTRVHI